ncbi:MAG: CAP domain-containing protein [Chloroflexi bacterium]|nr:MAG: hypothetical protein CUN54_07530 [Phototrophicales bacterium]RMF77830.1 MAG: CAP domain-containing protein [Chloroflexota bacterium]
MPKIYNLKIGHIVPVLVVLFAIVLIFSAFPSETAAQTSDRDAEFEVLGLLNQWRLEEGLSPLRLNDTLTDLAMFQADYVRTLQPIPDGPAIHIGRQGELVKDRALFDQFNWPFYGRSERIAVEEIAAVNSAEDSVAFWMSSTPHRRAVTNPQYREVGIAAIPHPFGHIFIIVLGARPNVLPVLVHPESRELYLTTEQSIYARDTWIQDVTQVRLFDADGRPLQDDWMDWQEMIALPENVGDRVFVLMTDGNIEVMSVVDLEQDIVVLPGHVPPPTAEELLLAIPTAAPLPTATPIPPGPELLVLYDRNSLTLVNVSRQALDLGDLEIVSDVITLDMFWWVQIRDFPIFQFPSGDCVQAWSGNAVDRSPRKPSTCDNRQSARASLRPDERFWLEGTFEVWFGGELVATCTAGERRCEIDLPGFP